MADYMTPKLYYSNPIYAPECDDCSVLEAKIEIVKDDVDKLEVRMTDAETDISSISLSVTGITNMDIERIMRT